jgi:hypothetical protein
VLQMILSNIQAVTHVLAGPSTRDRSKRKNRIRRTHRPTMLFAVFDTLADRPKKWYYFSQKNMPNRNILDSKLALKRIFLIGTCNEGLATECVRNRK